MSNLTRILAIALGISLAQQDRKRAKEEAQKTEPKRIIIEFKM